MTEKELSALVDPPDRFAPLRCTIWITLLVAIFGILGSAWYWQNRLSSEEVRSRVKQAFPGNSRTVLDNATQITLYSLDSSSNLDSPKNPPRLSPTSKPGEFHGFPILGQIVLSEAERKRVVPAIYGGFVERRIFRCFCFVPNHGLRAVHGNQTVDLVICFRCTSLHTYTAGREGSSPIGKAPEKYLNQLLTAAGVPFAPNYKP